MSFIKKNLSRTADLFLSDKVLIPPYSAVSTYEGWWVSRKRHWNSYDFKSYLGRAHNLLNFSKGALEAGGGNPGTFDPVFCELGYRWYCPRGGLILDPFSGGSVRGIVATALGFSYVGVDLRIEQIKENIKQSSELGLKPRYINGDSRYFADLVGDISGDAIFSSPPYYFREHYSDLPDDLNNSKDYQGFIDGYDQCVESCCSRLKDNSFACFEVAQTRDNKGVQIPLVSDTVKAFAKAGLRLHDDLIIMKALSSARMRTKMFKNRKFVPVHAHLLVFVKGSAEKAAAKLGGVV